jgi:hypothetical protein
MTLKVDDQVKCRYGIKGGGFRGPPWIGTVKEISSEPERYLVTIPGQVAPTWMLAHEVRPLSDQHWKLPAAVPTIINSATTIAASLNAGERHFQTSDEGIKELIETAARRRNLTVEVNLTQD